ncbi:PREDICTED: forkhead box protein D1-like [Bactrocera latifrons]|uniref:forkhead box protein D1-like n=1 Tax=Bactrocera latifrons TaxID=174628 RepID=UPI0008DDBB8E|nr:PREDICTED: forkhead box protein D1-like [Bactrocera latifrons]
MTSHIAIRNLLANNADTKPAPIPPPLDYSVSSSNTIVTKKKENHCIRPNYTYSALVAMAIRSSPEGKLTLSSIQSWISDNFPYYRKDEQGWQNQIRQTLSTNSCFCKIPRPMGDPGRGNYWTISAEVGALRFQQPTAGSEHALRAMVNGVPNAAYFSTTHQIQGTHQSKLVRAVQERLAWYQYHLQQTQHLQQRLVILQQQQIKHQYQEVYQKLVFHQQQVAFLTAQKHSV